MSDSGSASALVKLVRTAAPLYRDVSTALERAIREGAWKPGVQIPTESELEVQFGASRGTLRMAVSELVRKGLLHRQPGRGTFVLGPSFNSLERFFRYEHVSPGPRLVPTNLVLRKKQIKADAAVASALAVPSGSTIFLVRRLRQHDREPFLIVDSYFSAETWQLIKTADFSRHPLYDLLKDQYGLFIVSADEYLRAGIATAEQAQLLGIPPASAVILIERTACGFQGRPVEFRRAAGRADRFHYHVHLE